MKYLIPFLILVAFATHAFADKRVALVVGVGQYPEISGLPPIDAESDARGMADALKGAGWVTSSLTVLSDYQSRSRPNYGNILDTLGLELSNGSVRTIPSTVSFLGRAALESSDVLLFYFSGHGVTGPSGRQYLLPIDHVGSADEGSPEFAGIDLNHVRKALVATGAGTIIVIVDACRDGAEHLDGYGPSRSDLASVPGHVRYVEMQSTREGDRAFVSTSADRAGSAFSSWLVQGLDGSIAEADRDDNRCLTVNEWFDFASDKTRNEITQGRGLRQNAEIHAPNGTARSLCVADVEEEIVEEPELPVITISIPNWRQLQAKYYYAATCDLEIDGRTSELVSTRRGSIFENYLETDRLAPGKHTFTLTDCTFHSEWGDADVYQACAGEFFVQPGIDEYYLNTFLKKRYGPGGFQVYCGMFTQPHDTPPWDKKSRKHKKKGR